MMVPQVLLCFAVLIAPGTAAGPQAGRASCERHTDSALKAVCEQFQAGVSRNVDAAAGPQADAAVQGRVVSATHTAAGDLKHQQLVNSELSRLLRRFASGSLAGHEAMAEVLSHTGHRHPRHHRHRKPDRSEEEEQEAPSHEPSQHSPYKGQKDKPYGGYDGHNYPPAHGTYPPPAPIVSLYPNGDKFPYVFTSITPAPGKANATGDLKEGEDFLGWCE